MVRRYRAAWIFPVDQPPICNGVVAIEGKRIAAVGSAERLGWDEDWGDVAALPGLVNAHVHLDLSGLRGKIPPPTTPTAWLKQVIQYRRTVSPEETLQAIAAGAAECLRTGTTSIGDIDGSGLSQQVLLHQRLRGRVYRELVGLQPASIARAQAVAEGTAPSPKANRDQLLGFGLSPHAPYSVARALIEWTATQQQPLAMHLGEFRDEETLLKERAGPFRAFLEELGLWAPAAFASSWDEIVGLQTNAPDVLLAHGNYLPPQLWPKLVGLNVVYCPRTHAAFGHPRHPLLEMLAAGINVALGTDSLASNPDLNLWNELRYLWQLRGEEIGGAGLLRLGTLNGARALGLAEQLGSLTAGKLADVAKVKLEKTTGAEGHRLLFESEGICAGVLLAGEEVSSPGC